jgi:hypothetical protein
MSVTAGAPFPFTGSISGYINAPNLTYSINGATAIILPGVTATGWSTTLTVAGAGTYTIVVSDGSGTTGSVTFVASSATESVDKTDINSAGPTINASPNPGTAGSGNIIAITPGGQLSVNGVVIAATSGVAEIYYSNHTAYQFNGTQWFAPIVAGNGGILFPNNPKSPESFQNTDITTVGPTLNASPTPGTAGNGNIIAITPGGQVSVNGVTIASTGGVTELYYANHTAYQFNGTNWFAPIVAGNGGTLLANSPKVRNYLVGYRDGNPNDTTTAGLLGYAWEYTINNSAQDPGGGSGVSGLGSSPHPGVSVIIDVFHLDNGTPSYMDPVVAGNGGYNTFYTQTAQALIQYANLIHGVRIDSEFNGNWQIWGAFGGVGQVIDATTYINGWRNLAQAIRTALPLAKIIWNPNLGWNNPYPYYPGDDLVDLIGFDAYMQPAFSGTSTSAQVWQDFLNGQGGNNLTAMAAFGFSHNKPLCFPEWGDGFGDGYYITQFGAWMDQHNVVAHSYWDSSDGLTNTTALTQLPNNQAAFVKAFGHRPYTGTYWPSLTPTGGVSPPAQATAQGFATLTGGAEFNSQTDVTNVINGSTVAALYNFDGGGAGMPANGWSISNGILSITAATNHGQGLETLCNSNAPISVGPVSVNGRKTNIGTGMLFRYFYMEASIRFNWQAGPGAAFWTWAYNNGGAPNTLELDIVEVGSDSNVFSFWHGHGSGGDDGPNTGGNASLNGNLTGWAVPNQRLNKSNSPAVFNKYGLLWTTAKVEWYYNDVLIQNFATNTPIPWSTGGNQTANSIDNMGIMALAAIFGTWSEQMDIDWFRVWQ